MEIYQLRAFVTVARIGHLTRAAEVLHVTQPAVSGQIKALEEELGVALFDRKPGRIVLTRAGERMLPEAEKVLLASGALLAQARALQGEVSGVLIIGTVGDPESLRLGSLLGGLVSALPLLDIKTRAGDAEVLREDIAVPMADHDQAVIWPHTRVAATLSFIYPKAAEHDPTIVAALSVLRTVWGLPAR